LKPFEVKIFGDTTLKLGHKPITFVMNKIELVI